MAAFRLGNMIRWAYILIIWSIIQPGQARAGVVVLMNRVTAVSGPDGARVGIEIPNQGREAAFNLRPELFCLDSSCWVEAASRLEPGASYNAECSFPEKVSKPGRYPVLAMIDFDDENGASFSAVAYGEMAIGARTESNVSIKPRPVEIKERAEVSFSVVNWDGDAHRATVRWTTPLEFRTDDVQAIDLPPLSETQIDFNLTNESALPGSEYPSVVYLSEMFR